MKYTTEQLIGRIYAVADQYGIDRAVAYAQLKRESANFRADVVYGDFVGGDGERGVAQFIPSTWASVMPGVSHTAAYDPDISLTAWGKLLSSLLRSKGNYFYALKAYNGAGAAAERYAREILQAAGKSVPNVNAIDSGNNDSGFDWDELKGYAPYLFGGVFVLWLLSD